MIAHKDVVCALPKDEHILTRTDSHFGFRIASILDGGSKSDPKLAVLSGDAKSNRCNTCNILDITSQRYATIDNTYNPLPNPVSSDPDVLTGDGREDVPDTLLTLTTMRAYMIEFVTLCRISPSNMPASSGKMFTDAAWSNVCTPS